MDKSRFADEACARAQSMIRGGSSRVEILPHLATAAERAVRPGSAASILVLDEEGLLRNGASPNIPADYLDKIDRLKPRADLGTCASAAATGEMVITPDFRADAKWAELRHLPLSLGYSGAWSTPIKAKDGRVLGTFGIYLRDVGEPTVEERDAVHALAGVAATALGA